MGSTDCIYLGVRIHPEKYERIKLSNVDLENNVAELKKQAAMKVNLIPQSLEFIYCGLILDDTRSLSACGIKPGVTIHVLEKPKPQFPAVDPTLTEIHVQRLVVAFRSFKLSPGYRSVLQRLSRPEILENIIAATPGLADDPVAISIIHDPELIVQLADPDTVRRVVELHPALIVAAHHIAAYVHEETANINQNHAGTSSGYSYSLEALSDDEDDEEMESPSDPPQGTLPLTRNSSYSAITAAQVAAAIASANENTQLGSSTMGNVTAGTPTTSGNLITSEMFNNAMQRAFNRNSGRGVPANANTSRGSESYFIEMQPQLQQMREMGLTNSTINFRALWTSNGDVQAAIELVLSGAFE